MEWVAGIAAGVSFLFLFAALTSPGAVVRPQREERPAQYRVRPLRSGARMGFLAAAVEGLAGWFQGEGEGVAGWRGSLGGRYLAQLKQAGWYWAEGEPAAPDPEAPFWNLETLWAAKVLQAALLGLGGLVLAGVLLALLGWPISLAPAGLLLGPVGFFDPDGLLAERAERRRRQIVLEMGDRLPQLRSYVRAGRTFQDGLRRLTERPGGPFVREMHRVLQVAAATGDLERGVRAVMERNVLCQPLVSLCGDLLPALTERGGEVGVVLEAHADAAQHEQRRLLRQQAQDNTRQMLLGTYATLALVLALLIVAPVLWSVVTALGSF
jgi:hypothetical protein